MYLLLILKTSFKAKRLFYFLVFTLTIGLFVINPKINYNFIGLISNEISLETKIETSSEETEKLNDLEDLFCKNYKSTIKLNNYTLINLLFNTFFPQKPILKIPIPPPELA